MINANSVLWFSAALAAAAVLAIGAAWILRRSAIPGGRTSAGLLAGIVAGILIGPGVAGRVAPDAFERALVGGIAERLALTETEARHAREIAAVETAGVTPTYVADLRESHAREIAPLREALDRARNGRSTLLDTATAAIIAAHALLTGIVAAPLARAMRRTLARAERHASPFSPADALGAASFILILALIVPAIVTLWLAGAPARPAIGIGLAMALPALGAELRPRLLPPAAIAILLGAGAAAWIVGTEPGRALLPPAVVGTATLTMAAIVVAGLPPSSRKHRRTVRWTIAGATLPLVAALVTLRCDPQTLATSRAFWVVAITAVLTSSDGRWLAAAWAQKLFPRAAGSTLPDARAWTGATSLVNAGTGFAQLTLAFVLFAARVISPEMLAGLIAGAAAIELTRTIRTRVGLMLDAGLVASPDE